MFKTILIIGFISTTASSVFAQAAPLCEGLFGKNPSIMQAAAPQISTWVSQMNGEAKRLIRGMSQLKAIEGLVRAEAEVERTMVRLDAPTFSVRIIDRGLGARTPVEVVLTEKATKQDFVLLTSLKFEDSNPNAPTVEASRNNNSVVPVGAILSPDKSHLLVRVSTNGNIDSFTFVLIRISDRKIVREFDNVSSGDPVWLSSRRFAYRINDAERTSFTVTSTNGQTWDAPVRETANVRGSSDQLWYWQTSAADGGISVRSTLDPQKSLELPRMSLEKILATTKDPESVWLMTDGQLGFKDVLKFTVPTRKLERIVPEGNKVIEDADIVDGRLVVSRYFGSNQSVEILSLDGKSLASVPVPSCCTAAAAKFDVSKNEVQLSLSSPVRPWTNWSFDVARGTWSSIGPGQTRTLADPAIEMMKYGGEVFETKYESYRSKDGTVIPVRYTHKAGLRRDRSAPAFMEGYGGFGLNNYFHPYFETMTREFLRSGGVHIAPALRGSYFFGQPWHDGGRALNKQKVIDDFIGAAEWAIRAGLTQPSRLAIAGASHGGLVVAGAITQRPELFGLAFPQYGPLSFHDKPALDPLTTPYQVFEYGNLFADPAAQELARQISPELAVKPAVYPMTVVLTGRMDSRVNPVHSYRFAEALMNNQRGTQPILMYSHTNAGHWMSSLTRQDFIGWRTKADFWTLIFNRMGMTVQPNPPAAQ